MLGCVTSIATRDPKCEKLEWYNKENTMPGAQGGVAHADLLRGHARWAAVLPDFGEHADRREGPQSSFAVAQGR